MMILGAHQPNFIPWIGYFDKISRVDRFVLADDVQFATQSFINRARIKTAHGRQWLTVPVLTRGCGRQMIKDVRIDGERNWRQKHWKSMCINYGGAPFFPQYAPFFERLYETEWRFLIDLNVTLIEFVCRELAIETPICLSSNLDLKLATSTQRIINMVTVLDCQRYISGRGASVKYLQEELFTEAGIELVYNDFSHPRYAQQFSDFLPGMSIIDLLFNQGPACRELFRHPQEEMLRV